MTVKLDVKPLVSDIDNYLQSVAEFGFYGTVLVGQRGEVLLNNGYGFASIEERRKMTPDSVMSVGSISKQMTAVVILSLAEQGLIKVSHTLGNYFPTCPDDKRCITIHQLLRHTSGMVNFVGDDFDDIPRDQFVQKVFDVPLSHPPGSDFKYSNCGYSLLGIIIELVTGTSYTTYLPENFFEPLEMTKTGWFGDNKWINTEVTNYYVEGVNTGSIKSWKGPFWPLLANGGVCTTAHEMYSWIRGLEEEKLLTEESISQLLTPGIRNYAYGWDVGIHEEWGMHVRHNGGSDLGVNAEVHWFPEVQLVLVVLSNMMFGGEGAAFKVTPKILKALGGTLLPNLSKHSFTTEDTQTTLVGTYRLGDGSFELVNNNGIMFYYPIGQSATSLFLEGQKEKFQLFNKLASEFVHMAELGDYSQLGPLLSNPDRAEALGRLLETWKQEVSDEIGRVERVIVGGSYPLTNYGGATQIILVGTNGKTGFPLVWTSEARILGFRPLMSRSPFAVILRPTTEDKVVGLMIESAIEVTFIGDGKSQITLVTSDSKVLTAVKGS